MRFDLRGQGLRAIRIVKFYNDGVGPVWTVQQSLHALEREEHLCLIERGPARVEYPHDLERMRLARGGGNGDGLAAFERQNARQLTADDDSVRVFR